MKEVRRYTVIHKLSKGGIQNVGINKWMKKNLHWTCVMFVVVFGLMFWAAGLANNYGLISKLMLLLSVVVFFGWYYVWMKAGDKFWKKVKDKPEPIDLDEVK
jgi:uncharacterized membrane protein